MLKKILPYVIISCFFVDGFLMVFLSRANISPNGILFTVMGIVLAIFILSILKLTQLNNQSLADSVIAQGFKEIPPTDIPAGFTDLVERNFASRTMRLEKDLVAYRTEGSGGVEYLITSFFTLFPRNHENSRSILMHSLVFVCPNFSMDLMIARYHKLIGANFGLLLDQHILERLSIPDDVSVRNQYAAYGNTRDYAYIPKIINVIEQWATVQKENIYPMSGVPFTCTVSFGEDLCAVSFYAQDDIAPYIKLFDNIKIFCTENSRLS